VDPTVAVTKGRRDGRTALHWAARNGHVHVCEWLVASQHDDVNRPTKDGTTALMWAVWQGHVATCKALVRLGARLDARNSFGCTVAHWVALGPTDNLVVAEWLGKQEVDWVVRNVQGHSCLHKAAWKGHRLLCAWLLGGMSLVNALEKDPDARVCSTHSGALAVEQVEVHDEAGYSVADIAGLAGRKGLAAWLTAQLPAP